MNELMEGSDDYAQHEKALTTFAKGGSKVINLSGDTVTLKTAEYQEDQRSLMRWLFAFAKDQEWGWEELEQKTGINTTTLSRIWNDTYRYPKFELVKDDKGKVIGKRAHPRANERVSLDSICERIARFKELAEDRAYAHKLPFIETSVFKRIDKVCREALVMQAIAFIYGESQIGKSESLKEHARRNDHGQTTYVLMPASAGVQAMMHTIAKACHISVRTSFEQLRERVENYLDGTKLLIIDEVHECFVSYQRSSMARCLSVLRQLQEASQCGLVLCGTNVFRHELEQGEFSQSLKQLRKRGIWELQLENYPSARDLQLIADHYKLPAPKGEAAELVTWISKEMGLGQYTKFMARAAQLAAKNGKRFAWEHFQKVVTIAAQLKQLQGEGK